MVRHHKLSTPDPVLPLAVPPQRLARNDEVRRLDRLEVAILKQLQKDCEISLADLAERVGSTPTPCWRRIDRMTREGIIRRKVALLDPVKLGLSVQVYVMIKIDADGRLNLDQVSEQLCRMDEVVECHMLMGSFDFLLRVMVVDMEEYLQFLREKLNKVPYLSEVSSIVSLKQVKSVTEVPLT